MEGAGAVAEGVVESDAESSGAGEDASMVETRGRAPRRKRKGVRRGESGGGKESGERRESEFVTYIKLTISSIYVRLTS